MSSAPSDPGSFVIITQVRPQTKPGDATVEGQNENVQATMPKSLTRFYRGEPEVLGVTQIFSGIVEIAFGVVLTLACRESCHHLHALTVPGIPLWSGIAYIISGAISLAASIKPTLGKMRWSLGMNIFSAILAATGIVIYALLLVFTSYYFSPDDSYCSYYKTSQTCAGTFSPKVVLLGIVVILFVFTILEFCISLSTSVFGCKSLCRTSFNEMSVVIYQNASLNAGEAVAAAAAANAESSDYEFKTK
ncbi:membrane-spanning 4-domains subfamily A member 4A-like isoform X2 [Ascaphus truei]|uniref:membrane-spanning 4-domains subfamily A member 4A-like isoform X2 n=1 Tax=Ascaphus truei TaxID=8439 RepID=UPI003F59C5C8